MPMRSFLARCGSWPFSALLALAALVLFAGAGHAATVERLTVNGLASPLGIAAGDVSFGWGIAAVERGVVQGAYQLRVGTAAAAGDVWDPGWRAEDRQSDVRLPAQCHLASATRYSWQVRIRDGGSAVSEWSAPAWFETGLDAPADWQGAEWIGRPEAGPWTDYQATIDFTIRDTALGVLVRASADAADGSMLQVKVDGTAPRLIVHRKTAGRYAVLATVDLTAQGFTCAGLRAGRHQLVLVAEGRRLITRLDDRQIDDRTDLPLASGVLGFRASGRESAVVHQVAVVDRSDGHRLLFASDFSDGRNPFTGGRIDVEGYAVAGTMEAVWSDRSLPLLRRAFTLDKPVASARLYASALGVYALTLNGSTVGDQFLAPGWTDYRKRIQSQTYDVTGALVAGENVIGAALGDGWYRGKVGLGWQRVYGDGLALIAKLRITFTDGSQTWLVSDDRWSWIEGPRTRADLQDGETYDARLAIPGWDRPGSAVAGWQPVAVVTGNTAALVPQPDAPIRATRTVTARTRTTLVPGEYIYDLGQNLVGVARLRFSGRRGQTVTIRYAEELYRTGPPRGRLYTDNFRSAKVIDTYTCADDGMVTYQPTFTQHGFRYIALSGLDVPPEPTDVVGVVLGSDLADTGDLRIADPMLDQLVRNIRWGQRGNFLSIPTDTPARDERLGWTGDIAVFAPTACRYQDARAFLGKWLDDVRDAQRPDGNIPAVVPQPRREFDTTGVGWSDCIIAVPHAVWRATGDTRILRRNWEVMRRFYDFVEASATHDGNLLEEGRSTWFSGDWLNLEQADRLAEHRVIGTAYFAENTRMMAEMAEAMGDSALALRLRVLLPRIRAAFAAAYCRPDGTIEIGTQTVYAMALGMDLIPDAALRTAVAGRFVAKLAADGYHLRTGFLGTPWLLPALSAIGRDDLAMRLLRTDTYPSWGFEVAMGATTMWERWNSIRADGEFGPVGMNSFNHYAYGAVADWMYARIGGLEILEPGYRRVRIAPLTNTGLTSAHAQIATPYGHLACSWSNAVDGLAMTVEVPVNTSAEVVIPAMDADEVREGATAAVAAEGVLDHAYANGCLTLRIQSGRYEFRSPRLSAAPTSAAP